MVLDWIKFPPIIWITMKNAHGTAGISAILIFYPVKKAEDDFSIFGCHTDKSCNPHPENSPEASGENCGRDSYDIAAADTGSYGGAQSLKG